MKRDKFSYLKLLKKYIAHVGDCEGTAFIEDRYLSHSIFTEKEKEILIELSNQLRNE